MNDEPIDENLEENLENNGDNPQDEANVDYSSQVEAEFDVECVMDDMIDKIANPDRLAPRTAKVDAKKKIWHLADVFGGNSDKGEFIGH